jgi:hypothetical protein
VARGGEFATSACVDTFCKPRGDRCWGNVAEIVEEPQTKLLGRFRFAEFGSGVGGIEVFTCASGDELCSSPLGPPGITDAQGYLNVMLSKNFRGTMQVKNPPPGSDYLKLKVHLLRPFEVSDPPDLELPFDQSLPLLKRATLAALVSSRVQLSTNAGHIFAPTVDCDGLPRSGVRVVPAVALPASALTFYFVDGLTPSLTATETEGLDVFGIVNIPVGPQPLDVLIPSHGLEKIGRATLWINADTISAALLGPTFLPP